MRLSALPPALVLAAAIVAGASMDATIKYLVQSNHVLVVTLGRYAFATLFTLGIWLHAGRPRISAEMWRVHTVRGVLIAGCATSFFWSLTVLPLAEAVTLSFVYPLIVPFVAAAMIGERVRASSMVGAGIGFVGVVIAAQGAPPLTANPLHGLGVAAVLVSAALFAVVMVMLRARAQSDGAPIVGLMTSLVPGLILLGPTAAFASAPDLAAWPVFLLMGAFAAGFMYLMARAYAAAEAQQLAPIHYTELVWATLLGYVVFQETPRAQVYAGAVLIIAACLYATYDERRLARLKEPK